MARLRRALAGFAAAVTAATLAGGAARATAPTAAPFRAPVVVTDLDTGEPGVDIAPDGTIYVNAPSGDLSASDVLRSTDGGGDWALLPPAQRGGAPGGADSDIGIDPFDGTLYMTDLYLGSATVSRSNDRGNTWKTNAVQGTLVQDRQWIATAGRGVVYHVTHQLEVGLVVTKSSNAGSSFGSPTVAAAESSDCGCQPGQLVAEADRVGVIYSTFDGGVKFARSVDGARSWTNQRVSLPSVAKTTNAFPVVAQRGNGGLVAVWQETFGDASRMQFARSGDFGLSWTPPVTIVSGGTSLYPWVAARGDKVAVSLYHADVAATPDRMPKGAAWHEAYLESTDGGVTFSGLAILDPLPVKTGPICTAGVSCQSNRELLDFQSVAVDPAGRANVAWTRSLDGNFNTEIRFARQA